MLGIPARSMPNRAFCFVILICLLLIHTYLCVFSCCQALEAL
jgi:hypothetical protein